MGPREQKFNDLKQDAWYSTKILPKLKESEIEIVLNFIRENEREPLEIWEKKVNRMFLDKPDKPKNWSYIMEVLTVLGTLGAVLPHLKGRLASCSQCSSKVESKPNLPFFQYRGALSKDAEDLCLKCGFALRAHIPEMKKNDVCKKTVIDLGKCDGFEPHGAWEYDSFYCGCRGLD